MLITLSIYPTTEYPYFIAYTNQYNIRPKLAKSFQRIVDTKSRKSAGNLPYQIRFDTRTMTRYLSYEDGKSIENLLDYISHREEYNI